jgi:hypothetical protein
MLRYWFFNGPPNQPRKKLFRRAHPEFQELRAAHEYELHKKLRARQDAAAVLFLHWTYCSDAAEQMSRWSDDIRDGWVVAFYSGGGLSVDEITRLGKGCLHAGMRGRVFVYRSPFLPDQQAEQGVRRFVQSVATEFAARNGALKGVHIPSDPLLTEVTAELVLSEDTAVAAAVCQPLLVWGAGTFKNECLWSLSDALFDMGRGTDSWEKVRLCATDPCWNDLETDLGAAQEALSASGGHEDGLRSILRSRLDTIRACLLQVKNAGLRTEPPSPAETAQLNAAMETLLKAVAAVPMLHKQALFTLA